MTEPLLSELSEKPSLLIVDDDVTFCDVLAKAMTKRGFNVNCAHTLTFATEKEVVEETKEVIRKAAPDGGFILSSSNSIHSAVKPGNYLAMWNTLRMYGQYPINLDNWSDSGVGDAFS